MTKNALFCNVQQILQRFLQGGPKWHHLWNALTLLLTDFQNYFTVRIRTKFVIILSLCRYTTLWNVKCLKSNNFCTPQLHQILTDIQHFTYLFCCSCLETSSLAFGQCFMKVLFVYKEFCDYESGTLNFWRRLVLIVAFKTLDISQGSVAIHLRYDGIFNGSIITNFLLIMIVK